MKTDPTQPAKESLKDSTNVIPMFPLKEALDFTQRIHEEALETETMVAVAKGLGYAGNTSTGFYRRIVAARLFGLLSPSGASLTKRANDYFRPDSDDSKQNALTGAVAGIPIYAELLTKYEAKKINPELVGNGLGKLLGLTGECSQICASAFVSSIKLAGLLSADGIVSKATGEPAQPAPVVVPPPTSGGDRPPADAQPKDEAGTHTFVLPLDREKRRKITVTAPLDVTAKEIERINAWLAVSLNIGDADAGGGS